MQMHRKSGGHKIHPENSEKRIEVAGLHNALLHLNKLASQKPVKNLQPAGSRRRRKLNDNNAGERQQAKRRTKVGKTNNQKGAKRVCRASKYLKDTQAIQHGLERVWEKKKK